MARVRGEDGKFVKADDLDEALEPDAGGEAAEGSTSIEDLVGGEFDGAEPADTPADDAVIPGQIALGEDETPAPVDDSTAETASPAVEDAGAGDDDEPKIVALEEGGFQLGKFKADTIEELVLKVEKSRRNVESKLGNPDEREAAGTNPWLPKADADGGDEEDFDEIDGADFAQQVGQSIAQQLAPVLGQGAGVDPQQAAFTATSVAEQVLSAAGKVDEFATPEERQAFERDAQQALAALLQHAPGATQHREAVLAAWGRVNPYEAASTRMAIQQAEREYQQETLQAETMQQAQAAYQAEIEESQAYADAEGSFLASHPVAQQPHVRAAVDAMFAQPAMQAVAARAKGDRAAIHAAFELALQMTQATNPALFQQAPVPAQTPGLVGVPQLPPGVTLPGQIPNPAQVQAGMSPHVSEQAGIMQGVNAPQFDPNAALRAQHAQQRDLAGLESGAAVGDIAVSLTNPNSPELAQQPTYAALLGVGVVGE